MVEIIPTIIAKDFEDLQKKVKLVESSVQTVQLDIMDGVFVPNQTWNNPVELSGLETNLFLEAHLMIVNPHQFLNEWLASKVKRVILHWEALEKIHNHEILPYKSQIGAGFPISNLVQESRVKGKEFGVALNPWTPVTVLENFIGEIDTVLLMSVNPGFGGQPFQSTVIPKIAALRQKYPDVKIGVDGGVNFENIKELVGAGANFLYVGSFIFEADDPAAAIEQLKKSIKIN